MKTTSTPKVAKAAVSKKVVATKKTTLSKSTVVKKVAAKKVVTKKPLAVLKKNVAAKNVSVRKRVNGLICAPDDECFWTTDGQILKNLEDLMLAFGSMNETVFFYHANEDKNDFAEWVEHVLADSLCAADLRSTTTPKKATAVAKKHLKRYTSKS